MAGPGQDDFLQETLMEDVDPENLGQNQDDGADHLFHDGDEEIAARATITSPAPATIECQSAT